jgi:hypothetical protein
MNRPGTLVKNVALTLIGFVVPIVMLLPLDYALSDFGTHPDWNALSARYLPPATGCSLLFLASAMTSSTPRKLVTFAQSLFLHGTTEVDPIIRTTGGPALDSGRRSFSTPGAIDFPGCLIT